MKLHSRGDSAAVQVRLPILNTRGERSGLVRSLRTADVEEATARAGSLAALSSGIHNGDFIAVQRLVEDVFRASGLPVPVIGQHPLPELVKLPDFAADYQRRCAAKVHPRPVSASYLGLLRRTLRRFVFDHKGMSLRDIIGQHVQDWIDGLLAGGASVGTVRNMLAALSAMFARAVAMGHLASNPCDGVDLPFYVGVIRREPMAEEDFAKLLERARGTEWETAALLGRFAGLRIADACQVARSAVSFADGACLLSVQPGKTGRLEVLPLFGPVVAHLRGISGEGLLTPGLAVMSPDRLSKAFCRLCDDAGVDSKTVDLGNGRTARRVTFHSLRHSFVTDLSRRGIPAELRKKMSAHATDSAHAQYDHAGALDLHRQVAPFFTSTPTLP